MGRRRRGRSSGSCAGRAACPLGAEGPRGRIGTTTFGSTVRSATFHPSNTKPSTTRDYRNRRSSPQPRVSNEPGAVQAACTKPRFSIAAHSIAAYVRCWWRAATPQPTPPPTHQPTTTQAQDSCRVGGWRGGRVRPPRFQPPPHRTVHAVLPHTAHRRRSPPAFGLPRQSRKGLGATTGPCRPIRSGRPREANATTDQPNARLRRCRLARNPANRIRA